jgi:hypothetical protein
MKVIIQDDKIYNFVPDNYTAGNKEIDGGIHERVKIKEIKGFADGIDMDEVSKNKTRTDFGFFCYYLDDKGIVQKLGKGDAGYDEAYVNSQKSKRAEAYKKEADALGFKFLRGEVDKKVWEDKIAEIRDRYKYYEVSE